MTNSLRPHESQHTRPPCPSPTPRIHSNSCPLSRWCHPAISSSVVSFSSCPQSLPSIKVFSNESTLLMRWSKYWSFSFSISPSNILLLIGCAICLVLNACKFYSIPLTKTITGIWFYALVDKIDAKKIYIFWNRYSSDWQHENSNNFRFSILILNCPMQEIRFTMQKLPFE